MVVLASPALAAPPSTSSNMLCKALAVLLLWVEFALLGVEVYGTSTLLGDVRGLLCMEGTIGSVSDTGHIL